MTRIDYFFSLGSPWAYLGFQPLQELAAAHGATIIPHHIPLIEENGGIYSRDRPAPRRAYWFKDLQRWAARRGLPLALENRAALSDPGPAADLVLAAHLTGHDWQDLAWAFHSAFWGRGENIGAPSVRFEIARAHGLDADRLAAVEVSAVKTASLALAREKGIFGLPSYLVNGEIFWGQDSLPFLEDQLRAA
jgi:2-hydroxychromene-2-carboxylate isomerase